MVSSCAPMMAEIIPGLTPEQAGERCRRFLPTLERRKGSV